MTEDLEITETPLPNWALGVVGAVKASPSIVLASLSTLIESGEDVGITTDRLKTIHGIVEKIRPPSRHNKAEAYVRTLLDMLNDNDGVAAAFTAEEREIVARFVASGASEYLKALAIEAENLADSVDADLEEVSLLS